MTKMQVEGETKGRTASTFLAYGRKLIPFTLTFTAALIARLIILSTYSPYTTGSNYLVGKFVASGLQLYSKISWGYPPLYAYVLGTTYLATGGSFLAIGFIPILFSLLTLTFAYLVIRLIDGNTSGLLVSLVFAVSPIFPWGLGDDNVDPPYIALVLATVYFLLKYEASSSRRYMILSGVSAGLSLLMKQLALWPIAVVLGYALLRSRVRRDLALFIISSALSFFMLNPFLNGYTSLFSWVITVGVVPSVYRSVALPSGERLSRFLLGPQPVDALIFLGVIGCPYLAVKRRKGGVFLFLIYLASIILFLVLMPQIDTHHTVLVIPFALIGAGVLLNDIGNNLPVQSLRKVIKPLFLASILGAESILVVYPGTLSFIGSQQLNTQFLRECEKLITEHSSLTDYVLAPPEAVAVSGRNMPPEFARYPYIYNTVSEMGPYLEAYNVRLLFIEATGTPGFNTPTETDGAYINEHYNRVAHVVKHLDGMSPIHFDVFKRRS